jgi:hypothetical protein
LENIKLAMGRIFLGCRGALLRCPFYAALRRPAGVTFFKLLLFDLGFTLHLFFYAVVACVDKPAAWCPFI